MGFVIVTSALDGTPAVWGTPGGNPYGSQERAEQIADLMRNPNSDLYVESTMTIVLPVDSPWS